MATSSNQARTLGSRRARSGVYQHALTATNQHPGERAHLPKLVELSTSGKDFLLKIETRERERTGINSLKIRYRQLGLFGGVAEPGPKLEPSHQKVLEALRGVKVEETTPMEALNLLAKLQRELK